MKINRTNIPTYSLVNRYLPVNYTDTYSCIAKANSQITPDDILVSFWTVMPKWVDNLFKIRNSIVKVLGLRTDNNDSFQELEKCIRNGENYDFISIVDKSENETVMLLSDKHLDAYLSVLIQDVGDGQQEINVITLVKFHYWLGYLYFYTILPFHHLVVKGMMKNTLKKLYICNII
ncbi:MAG: DUF2867 domain-containing protein [Prevotella sp.]|jgi:hypothetical protein|nr:DUF2867 domain-containing protein [Prevotella sp.]